MIPLKLQLKNFLSYGSEPQTIDFSAYHLICLSGKNGHGKSAILDAITWALWGQARKISGTGKADQGLIRLGQTHMMVTLDFIFNNNTYRVRREFTLTYGKPLAGLEFGIINENNEFVALTDKTISATQDIIEKTLNLSYESFINSAFLRQGQSNEFSKKSPKERKDILATILGLNQYESVKKLALEKIRQLNADKTTRAALQEKLESELQKTGSINQQLLHTKKLIDVLQQEEVALKKKVDAYTLTQKAIQEDQKKQAMIVFQDEQLLLQQDDVEKTLRAVFAEWRTIHKKLLLAQDTQALNQEKTALIQAIHIHQQALQKGLELKEHHLKIKEHLHAIGQKIQADHTTLVHEKKISIERIQHELQTITLAINTKQKEADVLLQEHLTLTTEKNRITHEQAPLEKKIKNHTTLITHFERRKEYYQKFLEQGRHLTTELENLEQKKQLAHDEDDPSCPLCEQNLSAARKRFLKNKFVEQEHQLRYKLSRITKVVKTLKQILIEQHKEVETSKKIVETCQVQTVRLQEIEKNIAKVQNKKTELTSNLEQLAQQKIIFEKNYTNEQQNLGRLLARETSAYENNAEYQKYSASLAETEQAIKNLAYNQAEHKKAVDSLATIERLLTDQAVIIAQVGAQDQRKKHVSELCSTLKQLKKTRKDLLNQKKFFASLEKRIEELNQEEHTIQTITADLLSRREWLIQEKTRLETQYATLAQYDKEYKEIQSSVISLNATIADYQAIAAATGKDGIQALLIEDTIPEIEQEANYLLSRLTNNQSQVFFESLRDLKKGGTKETLDIKISDTSGIRPYEMFSGGEAFRIDFALRIAISKLLARRAGTSLQTLIIDEGFGSQDEEGLGLIMDCLYKIQEDFSKIIIVSHLPSMKDQFPVHFIVEKKPYGSTVTTMEQD
jgi:exonuclease SbcC